MRIMTKLFAGAAGISALAAAAPATAQVYGYPGYAQPYGNAYGYQNQAYGYQNNAYVTQSATQRCTAAVQSRLSTPQGVAGILGAVLGTNIGAQGRVLSVTQVNPRRNSVRVRGLATSGRHAGGYGPYGVGAYGAVGYGYQPDLSFSCNVDYNGYVRDIRINRR
jgi:hypothetical protein